MSLDQEQQERLKIARDNAKSNRNLGDDSEDQVESLALYAAADLDLEDAIDILNDAIASASAEDSEEKTRLEANLADFLGMRGGICRRMNRIGEALNFYREGFVLEEKLGNTSYNLSNVIALTIVKVPSSLREWEETIESSLKKVSEQENPGWWTHADKGLFNLLLGKPEEALKSYEAFKNAGPVYRDYKTSIDVLGLLLESLKGIGSPLVPHFSQAIAKLREYQEGVKK